MAVRGRPRSFDLDDALDRAVEVFWRQGYNGTSLDDLTSAMGINRPSLYAAFGNKESTFRKALARYAEVDMAYVEDALACSTARAVAETYLTSNAIAVTTPGKPAGCLSIQGGLVAGESDQGVVDFLAESRMSGEQRLIDRFKRAVEEGDLDDTEVPEELAKYVSTVSAGLAVQAAGGASRAELMLVVRRALRAFP
ncbi:TetR/AcrR family transcriptional regulator [Curtobacterium sp. MCPF17_001]|uniref:TetR/AcrR family transcriptional regulator n=1 Tax=Curtobacterium sp. MCPF17_001 TaxID=2175651 RepID=UPI000DAA7863|nr:TetR/AcrR family transcriptional regulator [Curtobacterium sp. MCPF17_001]PZE56973.1 TetR/AcrR family transcriptional regulator [Curtobacterium sp. MCPF17_001]